MAAQAKATRDNVTGLFSATNKNEADRFRERLDKLIRSGGTETMTISPVMAEVMLERNTGNRPVSRAAVRRYAKAMREGDWQLSGQPIIFSVDGILNDGQHRLLAAVEAGVSFRADLRFGIERMAFRVTDTGNKRSLADVLGIEGSKSTTILAGSLNWLNRYQKGIAATSRLGLTTLEGLALLERNPRLPESVTVGTRLNTETRLLSPSVASFLHYVFAQKDRVMADTFFACLTTGLDFYGKTDPRYVLRQRLIENKGSKASLPDVYLAAIAIKAWNAMRSGRTVQRLLWKTDPAQGHEAEEFPVVQ